MFNESQFEEKAEYILDHMKDQRTKNVMMQGEPGLGKTTFSKDLAQLVGLPILIIEVPYLIQEHIINIPIMVIDKDGSEKHEHIVVGDQHVPNDKQKKQEVKIEMAVSNLLSRLRKMKKVPDQQYLNNVYHKSSPAVIDYFEKLGGSEKQIPKVLQELRNHYECILFLDEFYRQTSPAIMNALRGLAINKSLGDEPLPSSVYVIAASNMRDDESTVSVMANDDWDVQTFDIPSKDEWFKHFKRVSRQRHIELNPDLIDIFEDGLTDEDMKVEDEHARISPRRWEQLLLYINSALPAEDKNEAQHILTNVKNNFINYQTSEHSTHEVVKKVINLTIKAIKRTSGHEVHAHEVHGASEWHNTLVRLIEAQKRLGEHRTYIPVLSGPPGIGKTSFFKQISYKTNLVPIIIEGWQLTADSVIGIPYPSGDEIKFAKPDLYERIMKQAKNGEQELFKWYKMTYGDKADEYIENFKNANYKYLIFFDELNRVPNQKVFNAIRRVILEKNFGADDEGNLIKLPQGSIVVGAINPQGEGTIPLTKHFRDVIDVVPATADWDRTWKYIESLDLNKNARTSEKIASKVADAAKTIILHFVDAHKDRDRQYDHGTNEFHLMLGRIPFYFSPREYEDMYKALARTLQSTVNYIQTHPDVLDNFEKVVDAISVKAFKSIKASILQSWENKHGAGSADTRQTWAELEDWMVANAKTAVEGIVGRKPEARKNFKHILNEYVAYVDSPEKLTEMATDQELNNIIHLHFSKEEVSQQILDWYNETVAKYSIQDLYRVFGKRQSKIIGYNSNENDIENPIIVENNEDEVDISYYGNMILGIIATMASRDVDAESYESVIAAFMLKGEENKIHQKFQEAYESTNDERYEEAGDVVNRNILNVKKQIRIIRNIKFG